MDALMKINNKTKTQDDNNNGFRVIKHIEPSFIWHT